MGSFTFALLLFALAAPAWALEPPPRVGAQPKAARQAAETPKKQAPKKQAPKRRAVHQLIEATPRVAPPASYGPRLTSPAPPPYAPMPSVAPLSPALINSCDAGLCIDSSGTRYQSGVGTTLLSPQGRLCVNNGTTIQCF